MRWMISPIFSSTPRKTISPPHARAWIKFWVFLTYGDTPLHVQEIIIVRTQIQWNLGVF
jgi:hypothetical protein